MRLPYVPNPPQFQGEADQAIVRRVQERRGERGLLELDRALLHSPPVADGWNSFLGAIRTRTSISASIRETAICRVAVLNRAWYEWMDHAPLLRATGDLDERDMEYIARRRPKSQAQQRPGGTATDDDIEPSERLTERHLAVLDYTDAMTMDVSVPDELFARLRTLFSEREVVEITATVGAYNCVSRFLVALNVGEKNADTGPDQ
ncbi:4-carboxymuconolactone decarboxylase [Diplodia corticola]|uniref:4-carboxymuconolactone decarboxylase n=1 Tax=Diplodia corticola TaxID=236234 RepID=A0A1J9RBA9_9PEZI|nr:4-carboxymuconolactone decarboxylase [Diplodia corticola]OJD29715.1 4-carboxymuconolactone decarboxylase [Diplodia corticola]